MDWAQEKTLLELQVSDLTLRLKECRKELKKAQRAARRKRVPVLVRVDPNGDVSVYGVGVEVEIASMPVGIAGPRALTLAEVWIDECLPERFRDLHVPGCCVATVNARSCRTLTETYEAFAMQESIDAMNELNTTKGPKNAPTKDSTQEESTRRTATPRP